MAGSIIISNGKAFSLGTAAFHFIVERIRSSFADDECHYVEEIYGPLDNEGMSFIALDEQAEDGFNIFYRASKAALSKAIIEDSSNVPLVLWQEMIAVLEADKRWSGNI